MKSSLKDLPVSSQNEERVSRVTDWGGMTVYASEILKNRDHSADLPESPDDLCQCRHWGYVIKGQIHARVGESDEVFNEGDLFYLPPGHEFLSEAADTQYIVFMLTDEWEAELARKENQ